MKPSKPPAKLTTVACTLQAATATTRRTAQKPHLCCAADNGQRYGVQPCRLTLRPASCRPPPAAAEAPPRPAPRIGASGDRGITNATEALAQRERREGCSLQSSKLPSGTCGSATAAMGCAVVELGCVVRCTLLQAARRCRERLAWAAATLHTGVHGASGAPASASLSRSTGTQVRRSVWRAAGGAAPCTIAQRRAWRLAGPPRPSRRPSILPGREWSRRRGLGGPREQRWHSGRARAHPGAAGG